MTTTMDDRSTSSCGTPAPGAAASGCGQGYLSAHLSSFTSAMNEVDNALAAARTIDAKTDELIRFALSVKGRSEPCVRKHFVGAKAAGASDSEIAYVLALTLRESAGADDCWTHSIIASVGGQTDAQLEDEEMGACCG